MDRIQACLASNMKRYRKQLHLSQEKLAEEAKASANYIAMIENGRCFPSLQMLRQIASALKVDSLDLFDKDGFEFQNLEILRKNMIENIVNCVNKTFDEIK